MDNETTENGLASSESHYSWTICSPEEVIKHLDKTAFLHRSTRIPKAVRSIFKIDDMLPGQRIDLILKHNGKDHSAYINREVQSSHRTELFWFSSFSKLLEVAFKDSFTAAQNGRLKTNSVPSVIFTSISDNGRVYEITLKPPIEIQTEIELKIAAPPSCSPAVQSDSTIIHFGGNKIDFEGMSQSNKIIGESGERKILALEKEYLLIKGRPDLAERVVHTSEIEGDGAGYDILSYDLDGGIKYIEVKTTSGSANTPFYISRRELAFSEINLEQYYLYRVYGFDITTNSIEGLYIEKGSLRNKFHLEPIQYIAIK